MFGRILSENRGKLINCGEIDFVINGLAYNGTITKEIDISRFYRNFKNLNEDNFILQFIKNQTDYVGGNNANLNWQTPKIIFNKDTGKLKIDIQFYTGLFGTNGAYIRLKLLIAKNFGGGVLGLFKKLLNHFLILEVI